MEEFFCISGCLTKKYDLGASSVVVMQDPNGSLKGFVVDNGLEMLQFDCETGAMGPNLE